jgi:hypothetical protein
MATAYTASNTLPLNELPNVNGVLQNFKATIANSGSATYAPDGLAAAPIFGLGGQPLQGNEIVANGIVTLTSYVGPLLNSGALCWILSDCTGGELQVAVATQSQHATQFSQLTGVVGSVRNAKMSITAASASGTFTADEIVVATALGGLQYRLGNFSKTINLATTGAGGMDSGTAPASGYVALYAIYNPTTATASILATNATSAVAGNVYGGANMPSGYTASALVSVWPTTTAGILVSGYQMDRVFSYGAIVKVLSTTAASVAATMNIAAAAPLNAKSCTGASNIFNTASGYSYASLVGGTASGVIPVTFVYVSVGNVQGYGQFSAPIITAQTLAYQIINDGSAGFSFSISSYSI